MVGKDDRGLDFKRFSITALSAETEGAPRVYMQPQTTAYRMASVNLTCDVDSRAPYTLYFTRGTHQIGVPLYFKYVYRRYIYKHSVSLQTQRNRPSHTPRSDARRCRRVQLCRGE